MEDPLLVTAAVRLTCETGSDGPDQTPTAAGSARHAKSESEVFDGRHITAFAITAGCDGPYTAVRPAGPAIQFSPRVRVPTQSGRDIALLLRRTRPTLSAYRLLVNDTAPAAPTVTREGERVRAGRMAKACR